MTETCPNCGDELTTDNAAGGLCGRCLLERGIEFTSTLAVAEGSTPGTLPFTAPDPIEVEADLLNFDVLELIGQGGMGAVYKARQRNLDRMVAIKILPRQAAGGHEFAERFQREARALARLRHDNIVMAYDYGLTDRYLYSVMEYVGGHSLRELMRERPIDARRALEIARDICAALQYAHENGVVHRDIKPENILLDEAGHVKIADFGLAKLLQPDPRELPLTHTRHFMGTLHYMAPEQCERPHETDHRADIYSVGVVLYEMLTGELPIGRFEPPSSRAAIDPLVDDVVLCALEKDPARRYQTAAGFGEAIQIVLATADANDPSRSIERPDIAVQTNWRRFSGRKPLIAAAVFGLIAIAFFGWQILLKYQRDKEGNTTFSMEAKGRNDQAATVAGHGARPLPRGERLIKTFRLQHADAKEVFNLLDKIFADSGASYQVERGKDITIVADSDTMNRMQALVKWLDQPELSDRPRARQEAIDRGEIPEALLMDQIRSDPEMIELRKEIAEAAKTHQRLRAIAENPQSNSTVRRAAEQLMALKEAEDQLAAELREIAIAKLRWGSDGPPKRSDDGDPFGKGRPETPFGDSGNPFGEPSTGDPFGKGQSDNPFGDSETANPFGPTSSDDPFGSDPSKHADNPFGPPADNPFAPLGKPQKQHTPARTTLVEHGWAVQLNEAGQFVEMRQLTNEELFKRVEEAVRSDPTLVERTNKLLSAKHELERLRAFNASTENTPQGKAVQQQIERLQREVDFLTTRLRTTLSKQSKYPSRDATRDNRVTIFSLPASSTNVEDQWPRPSAGLPIGLRFAEDVQKQFGKLAVEYRFYGHTPVTMVFRGERGDEQLVIPYVLVIKGPHLGRKEFVLPNWPERDKVQELVRTPGVIFAPANLKINNGEPLEIFIERGDPRSASRVRVSTIVKLTWTVPDAPATDIRHPEKLMQPFTAIHWKDGRPQVAINDRWYELLAIDGQSIEKILEFAKKARPTDYEKAFEDDLAGLLKQMGHEPGETMRIQTRRLDSGVSEEVVVERGRVSSVESKEKPRLIEEKKP